MIEGWTPFFLGCCFGVAVMRAIRAFYQEPPQDNGAEGRAQSQRPDLPHYDVAIVGVDQVREHLADRGPIVEILGVFLDDGGVRFAVVQDVTRPPDLSPSPAEPGGSSPPEVGGPSSLAMSGALEALRAQPGAQPAHLPQGTTADGPGPHPGGWASPVKAGRFVVPVEAPSQGDAKVVDP